MIGIQWIEKADPSFLKRLIEHFAKPGVPFELHCWNEETDAIALAKSIAKRKENNWKYGVYFSGHITPENLSVLETITEGEYCTPFFDILIDNDLCCEHWGTEIYILRSTLYDAALKSLLNDIADCVTIHEFRE